VKLYENFYLHSSDRLRNVLLLKISVTSHIEISVFSLDSQFCIDSWLPWFPCLPVSASCYLTPGF